MGMCRCEHGLVRSLWHDVIIVRIFCCICWIDLQKECWKKIYMKCCMIYIIYVTNVYRLHVNINNIHDGFLPLGKDWSAI